MSDLKTQVKEMLIHRLRLEGLAPDQIDDEAPLFDDGLGLDSIDALELVLGVEQTFGVRIEDEAEGLRAFRNITSLTAFITEKQAG